MSASERAFRVSRITAASLLLAALIGVGLRIWNNGYRDACSAWLAGDRRAQSTMYVSMGTRTVMVRCDDWIERVPAGVQVSCLVELGVVLIFLLHAAGDVRDWMERRRGI